VQVLFCLCGIGGSVDPDGGGRRRALVDPGRSLRVILRLRSHWLRRVLAGLHAGSENAALRERVYLHPPIAGFRVEFGATRPMRCSWVSFDVLDSPAAWSRGPRASETLHRCLQRFLLSPEPDIQQGRTSIS